MVIEAKRQTMVLGYIQHASPRALAVERLPSATYLRYKKSKNLRLPVLFFFSFYFENFAGIIVAFINRNFLFLFAFSVSF